MLDPSDLEHGIRYGRILALGNPVPPHPYDKRNLLNEKKKRKKT